MLIIGIDPGRKTGIAAWDTDIKEFKEIDTMRIDQAIDYIGWQATLYDIHVRVEDARKRKWFGKNASAKQQGAGSIKRDCIIWEDFLRDHEIPYDMPSPKQGTTKMKSEEFKKVTGYKKQTSEHARDAALLVFSQNAKMMEAMNELK